MPIKNREQRRLARIGKIHRGVKVPTKDGNSQRPSAVNHFVVHEEDTTPLDSAKAFWDVYGRCSRCNDGEDVECNGPRELFPVMFPTDDPAQWADEWYRMYNTSLGLTCRGDGEKAHAKWDVEGKGPRPDGAPEGSWANAKSKDWIALTIPCPGPECPMQQGDKAPCGITMNLQFLLPRVRGIGVWQTDLKSIHSINNIRDNVETIRAVTGGRIRGLPLTLRIVPKSVTPKGEKKKTVWVLDLSLPDVSLEDLLRQAAKLPENMLMLPPPADDSGEPEPEEEEEEPVMTGPGYTPEKLANATAKAIQPDAVEPPPATQPKKTVSKKSPADVVKETATVNSVDDLVNLDFKNIGELYEAGWKHFKVTRTLIEKEAADEIRDKRWGDAWRKVCAYVNAQAKAEPFA